MTKNATETRHAQVINCIVVVLVSSRNVVPFRHLDLVWHVSMGFAREVGCWCWVRSEHSNIVSNLDFPSCSEHLLVYHFVEDVHFTVACWDVLYNIKRLVPGLVLLTCRCPPLFPRRSSFAVPVFRFRCSCSVSCVHWFFSCGAVGPPEKSMVHHRNLWPTVEIYGPP